ncbi:2-C-methyl-D-erythritol 4-phosphate cytidylyltransferase [Chryseosolibacter indicus]|uniref:2-C-methyl-D-erythritol 4-phosphate cytidylyltransferase n=1 Tax=Chryseosolibacter indicus TaxID=2782351 RepID=A0ABS5VRV1_9BACT|nr:2-C-methyl-D-erythritol 4-phosphate cytidylyltransferase [Chryseosolibacter indicus]MBT1704173.1 2-C-methyl-D-erythritol 4-phosphate cytidylyltransferase [Chryseosolibacter indicus]
MSQNEYAVIVAGGKGTRIKSSTPKQFLELAGKPIILHTIEAFYRYSKDIRVILVLPADAYSLWDYIVKDYNFQHTVTLQQGGESRFQSVKKGLQRIQTNGLVAIHDGVRPLVTTDIIESSFKLAKEKGSAVAAVSLKESVRILEGDHTKALDRAKYRLIQTPQTFDIELIKKAYELEDDPSLTDDASVAERWGHTISLFEGNYENIKVTTPEDLIIAEVLLQKRKTG